MEQTNKREQKHKIEIQYFNNLTQSHKNAKLRKDNYGIENSNKNHINVRLWDNLLVCSESLKLTTSFFFPKQ